MKPGYYWAVRKGQTEEEVVYLFKDDNEADAVNSHKYDRPVLANLFKIIGPILPRLSPISHKKIKARTYYWAERWDTDGNEPSKREVVYVGKMMTVFTFGEAVGVSLDNYRFFKEVKETEE